jgi:arylsulfatase A-like enzyme
VVGSPGLQRHLLQVAFADKLIGNLIARLKTVGLYNDALIVIMADHGVSWVNDNIREITKRTILILWVYLYSLRCLTGAKESSAIGMWAIDILPTIADVLGIRIPWPLDGSSILDTNCRSAAKDYSEF